MGTVTFRCEEQKALSIKLDQCIEQTVNREQKCRERIYAFSTSEGTVQRWTLISHCVAQCVAILRNDLRCSKTNRKPKDCGKSRIEFSNKSADWAYDVLKQWGNPFDKRDSLINICSGKEATSAIRDDITNALKIGENAFATFRKDRLKSKKVDFYAPIKRLNLKSFKTLEVKKTIKLKDKSIIIATERTIFARFLALTHSQGTVTLKQIFCYSLSPIPWALGHPDGSYVKTQKSKLLSKLWFMAYMIKQKTWGTCALTLCF